VEVFVSGINKVSTVTIAVKDQDEALRWFTEKLGFEKRDDFAVPGTRWLTVAPSKQTEVVFLLASWFPEKIGFNPTCVVDTDDCHRTYEDLKSRGVEFSRAPSEKPYGIEAVFKDLYGNNYALVEQRRAG
jgi:predicted enzyme related to lactoylglutathione lyase